jgi:hypothetical protein
VLFPGLPLQLWNDKALESIGNELGRFIKVDEAAIKAPDKRIKKVLMETDIHNGLLEAIKIYWRGEILGQKLCYLGVPFRCSICPRIGHLRRDCQGFVVEDESEASMIIKENLCDSLGVDSYEKGDFNSAEEEARLTSP